LPSSAPLEKPRRRCSAGSSVTTPKKWGSRNTSASPFHCEGDKIVGGIVGEVWTTVLFIQLFWMEQKLRGKDYGTRLIKAIEDEARKFGATRSYLDTMSFQAPGFYRACGYEEFGSIEGYPKGVTRHWFTKAL
jgi:GNAT superfamily N-acetyltransferase